MRRLQSFKSPSKLNEKLKFSNKGIKNGEFSLSDGMKFIPNIDPINSNNKNSNIIENINHEPNNSPDLIKEKTKESSESCRNRYFSFPEKDHFSVSNSENQILALESYRCTTNKQKESNEKTIEIESNRNNTNAGNWLVFQLPKYLPPREGVVSNDIDDAPSMLQDIPSGSIGKLRISESGEMILSLNNSRIKECVSFKVDRIYKDNSEQFITAFAGINELLNLGKGNSLLIATPRV
ncbi:RNA polymerase III RPC4 family protein [Cryptosporidium felis]|nr:RNA polymerase III RPC4 family protein [Cryptosporidium felis]